MTKHFEIHFPPDQDFRCTACGKCCAQDWRVVVHESERKTLESLAVYKRVVREGYRPLTVVEGQLQLNRRPDHTCYFLNENLCEVHGEGGARAKPAPCRLFPFQLVYTPGGYFVSYSFTCPAVIAGTGELNQETVEGLRQTILDAVHFFPPDVEAATNVTISHGIKLPYDVYLNWEHQILDRVRRSNNIPNTLLDTVAILALALSKGQLPEFAAPLNDEVRMLSEKLHDLLLMFRNIFIATLEECEDLEKRTLLLGTLAGGIPFYSEILGLTIPVEEPPGVRDQLTRSILTRYTLTQLWGKRLMTGPTLVSRLLLLAAGIEVFWFYLAGSKQASDQLHFAPEQVENCFEILETRATHHYDILLPAFEAWESDIMTLAYQLQCDSPAEEPRA